MFHKNEKTRRGEVIMNLYQAIEDRISIRKYEDKLFDAETMKRVKECFSGLIPLYDGIKVRLELIEAAACGLGFFYGLAKITAPYCVVAISEVTSGYKENIGFLEEQLVLKLTDLGIGTCWLGTFNNAKIREMLKLEDAEIITNVIATGYPFEQRSFKNGAFRNLVGRKRKKDFELAYDGQWGEDIREYLDKNPSIRKVLNMSALAPSGGNKQPVYVVFNENTAAFFVKNKKDNQVINDWAEMDAGIFVSHFYLCLKYENYEAMLYKEVSTSIKYKMPSDFSYIISVQYKRS
jgi:hypothetical protein